MEPEINPDFHELSHGDFFWIAVRSRTGDGSIVAAICVRLVETPDLLEALRTQKVVYGSASSGKGPLPLALPTEAYPYFSGGVALISGRYVAPVEEGVRLPWYLERLGRAFAVVRWPEMKAACTILRDGSDPRVAAFDAQGFTELALLFDSGGSDGQTHLASISTGEVQVQMAQDLSLIEMNASAPAVVLPLIGE